MIVGLILEGGPSGPDKMVCELLVQRLRPGSQVTSVTLGPKPSLISQSGKVTATLFQNGCDCVIIVWDLYPAWSIQGSKKPCLKKDREAIRKSLTAAAVTSSRVHLVCIHKMLEAWLLADEKAISACLSKLKKKIVSVPRTKRPEDPVKPKIVLGQIFEEYAGAEFQAHIHAASIIKEVKDFKRLDQCKSFAYFRLKLADC
jgi:hypothetical protein